MKQHNLFLLALLGYAYNLAAYDALVIDPVVDMTGSPAALKPSPYIEPISIQRGQYDKCPRLHQSLFNEIVYVLLEDGPLVQVETPSAYYLTAAQPDAKQNKFWMPKKSIMPLSKLPANCIQYIPRGKGTLQEYILLQPVNANDTCKFSAGTRLVGAPITPKSIQLWYFCPSSNTVRSFSLPVQALMQAQPKDKTDALTRFVNTARRWATGPKKIPYVWGGNSIGSGYNRIQATEQGGAYFLGHKQRKTHCGVDCSGLVLRAAQSAGIPYQCKNTFTLKKVLTPITADEAVENGDLIWVPGHVIIISDVDKNKAIESRNYEDGYGYVHETTIDRLFGNISEYEKLKAASVNGQKLARLNKQGNTINTVPVTILKMRSVWPHV